MYRLSRFVVFLGIALAFALPLPRVQSAPVASPSDSVFGVNSHIASRYPDPSSMNVPAQTLGTLGVGWVREDFQFDRMEPQPDTYDWEFHDNAINELTSRGINIIGILGGPTPAWATPGGQDGDFYPPNPQDYADFVAAVVSRYKGQVHYWEIWNEPDNPRYWKPSPDPVAYTTLLKIGYAAVKSADPNAKVLVAGIVSPEPATSYLQTIATNGGWNSFDIISLHPYTDPKGPEDGNIASAGLGQVQALAERLGKKPIWVTEYGWSTGNGGRGDIAFGEEDQANFLVRGAVLLRAAGAERVLMYNLKDTDLHSSEEYGLLGYGNGKEDYTQTKTSFYTFKTLNEQLAGATPVKILDDLGQQELVADFESFGSWGLGDQKYGTISQAPGQGRNGSAAAQISYNFPSAGNDYVVFLPSSQPVISGNPNQFGVWVKGDSNGHALKVWLRDAQGEVLQYRLGFVGGGDWKFLSTPVDAPVESYNVVEGSGDRMLTTPATVQAIVLDDEPDTFSGPGAFYIDDMTAASGAQAYGARFSKGSSTIDVLWAPQVATIPIATNSAQGTLTDSWGGVSTPSSSNGTFSLTLGPSPVYLNHTPGTRQVQQPTAQPTTQPTTQPTPTPVPTTGGGGGGEECFSQTGYCISGRIREYWHDNGGLPVFGYPIGTQHQETIEGKAYQVQWFERNRLELHPENARPYDVLLGRLSEDLLYDQGRIWQDEPKSSAQSGCMYFDETGFNICGDILQVWRANGLELDGLAGKTVDENLALFGLPLGDAAMETIEGKQYLVQWFERARFEVHPENEPPYNVLLGLLGNEIQGR